MRAEHVYTPADRERDDRAIDMTGIDLGKIPVRLTLTMTDAARLMDAVSEAVIDEPDEFEAARLALILAHVDRQMRDGQVRYAL